MNLASVKRAARQIEEILQRTFATVGMGQSESKISTDSQAYWTSVKDDRWKGNSHWRSAGVFADGKLWSEIGRRHLLLFERGARTVDFRRSWSRVVEWGCGGGANAIHFAPRADEFIGVDISEDTLAECGRQVAEACDTPFRPIRVEVTEPEKVLEVAGSCDIFLCFYVFELLPTPEYGARLLRIAHQLLNPGGLALVQIKYDDGRWATRPRRRAYKSGLADMTTYPIAAFWELAVECGLTPESIELVPKNELDERYAYFLLSRAV